MKIAILTYHHTTNYGATLQSYALYSYLKRMGLKVSILDYRPKLARDAYFKQNYLNKFAVYNYLKSYRFNNFVKKHIKITPLPEQSYKGLLSVVEYFDVLITGSDEVWNFDSFRGFDASYFLGFDVKGIKKLSYAASFGQASSYEEHNIKLTNFLNNFDKISVRDFNSYNKVKEYSEKEPLMVLDPTFLINYDKDVINNPKVETKYVLIYGVVNSNQANEILKFSKEFHLKIISVGYYNRIAHKNYLSAGIEDWLGLMKKADFIYTNFYHGLLFAIHFNKPYKIFTTPAKSNKVLDILNSLSLNEDYSAKYPNQSYNFRGKIEKLLHDSENFLKVNLGIN